MTGFILPTSASAPIAQWSLRDWGTPTATSSRATGGTCTATFEQLGSDTQWLIDRAVVSCTSSSATSLRLYDTDPRPANLLSGTQSGNFDEAEYNGGLLVPQLRQLVAVWTGCDDGAVGTIRLQVRVMARAS